MKDESNVRVEREFRIKSTLGGMVYTVRYTSLKMIWGSYCEFRSVLQTWFKAGWKAKKKKKVKSLSKVAKIIII